MPVKQKQIQSSDLKATIKGFDGVEKEYVFNKLRGKEALRVFHETAVLLAPVLGAFEGAQEGSFLKGMSEALSKIPFDDVYCLAERLFLCLIVDKDEVNIDEYFAPRPEEFYLALYHAVKLNFPSITEKLEAFITDSNVSFGSPADQEEDDEE